jgi:hypothetical protein
VECRAVWDLKVIEAVAGNPRTPDALLERLCTHCQNVRYEIAENPGAPANVLRALLLDKEDRIALAALLNPSTPKEAIRTLAKTTTSGVVQGEIRRMAKKDLAL